VENEQPRPGDKVYFTISWFDEPKRVGTVVGNRLVPPRGNMAGEPIPTFHVYDDENHNLYYLSIARIRKVEPREDHMTAFLAAEDRYRKHRREGNAVWRKIIDDDPDRPMFYWERVPSREWREPDDESE